MQDNKFFSNIITKVFPFYFHILKETKILIHIIIINNKESISKGMLENYEKSFTEPSLSIAKTLADFYEIKIRDFFVNVYFKISL